MLKRGILDKQTKAKPALPQAPTKNPPLNFVQASLVCKLSVLDGSNIVLIVVEASTPKVSLTLLDSAESSLLTARVGL